GRDVFAPVAAALATGTDAGALGPTVPDLIRLRVPEALVDAGTVRGEVIYVDHFGNLTTNLKPATLPARPAIRLGGVRLAGVSPSYDAVAVGQPVAVVNSWGLVEIAVRDGSARATLGARVGDAVLVETGA